MELKIFFNQIADVNKSKIYTNNNKQELFG